MDTNTLFVNDELQISTSEITYRFARSGGPGGQHVNRSETQVELLWDVGTSASLSDSQRARLFEVLANRIDKNGILHLRSGQSRSQEQNRRTVTNRLVTLLRKALEPEQERKKTGIPKAAKAKRLDTKRKRSEIKKSRRRVVEDQ